MAETDPALAVAEATIATMAGRAMRERHPAHALRWAGFGGGAAFRPRLGQHGHRAATRQSIQLVARYQFHELRARVFVAVEPTHVGDDRGYRERHLSGGDPALVVADEPFSDPAQFSRLVSPLGHSRRLPPLG